MAPQIKLIKLFYENDERVKVDKEVEDILN